MNKNNKFNLFINMKVKNMINIFNKKIKWNFKDQKY